MEPRHRDRSIRAALMLLAITTLLAPLVVLRSLPPSDLTAAGLDWMLPALSGCLLLASAVATIATLVAGLRDGSLASLLLSGATGALAGSSVVDLAGLTPVTLPVAAAAVLLLAAAIVERGESVVAGHRARLATATLLLVAVEAALVAELMPAVSAAVAEGRAGLLLAAALAAATGAILAAGRDLGPAAATLAVGAAALALARGNGAELVLGVGLLVSAAILVARSAIGTRTDVTETDDAALPVLALQLSEGILRFDGHLRLRHWNPAAASLLGLDTASGGTHLGDLLGISLAQLPAGSETVLYRTPVGGLDLSIHREPAAVTVVIHEPGTSPDGERLGRELRGTIEELLQARRTIELQRAELERATTLDPLTGVASRSAIVERLRADVAQARRYQHPVAVVLLDIDGFGEINAAHGIDGGDAVLREVALRARLRVRAADAIGRSGSDGLLAVLPHTDEGGAARFADAVRRRIGQRPISLGGVEVSVTLSAGVAVMRPGEELDLDGLVARAVEALSSARQAGGDRIALDRLHGLARLEARERTTLEEPAERQDG